MKKKLRAIVEDSHFFDLKSGAKGSEVELFWRRSDLFSKPLSVILVSCYLSCLLQTLITQ